MKKKFRGRHTFICMVDGMEYPSEEKAIRWDGLIVHKKNCEPRHPQDMIKSVREDTSVPNPSPEGPDTFITETTDELRELL